MAKASQNSAIHVLEQTLARGEVKPVYLLLGEEPFLRHRARNLIHDVIVGKHEGTASIFTSDDPLEAVLDSLRGDSLFASRRMVEIIGADKFLREKGDAVARYLDRPSASGVLVLDAAKVDGRTKLPGAIRAAGMIVDCPLLREGDLPGWVRAEAARRAVRIAPAAVAALLEEVGNNLFALDAEIDKLSTYAGDKKEIQAQDVSRLTGSVKSWAVWALTDALGKRDAGESLRILPSLLEEDPRGVQTVGVLNWHFSRLAEGKYILDSGGTQNDLMSRLRLKPYSAQVVQEQAKLLSMDDLARLLRMLLDVDIALKSSGLDPRMLLERFLVGACGAKSA